MRDFINLMESTARTLYHGTLVELLPEIEQYGLIPTVGDFVSNFYDQSGNENYDPERDALEPLIFAAQKSDLIRCVLAIQHRLKSKNIKPTPTNVIRYGAIIAVKDESEYSGFYHRDHEEYDDGQHPIQVEPGDYYAMDNQAPLYIATGNKLSDLLRRERINGFYSPRPPIRENKVNSTKKITKISTNRSMRSLIMLCENHDAEFSAGKEVNDIFYHGSSYDFDTHAIQPSINGVYGAGYYFYDNFKDASIYVGKGNHGFIYSYHIEGLFASDNDLTIALEMSKRDGYKRTEAWQNASAILAQYFCGIMDNRVLVLFEINNSRPLSKKPFFYS